MNFGRKTMKAGVAANAGVTLEGDGVTKAQAALDQARTDTLF